jgi:hypothetical protein
LRWRSSIRQLTAMIHHSVSFNTTWILRFLLLISVALLSACENEENIRPQTQSVPSEPPLPVREWYPTPKHRQQPTAYVLVPATQSQPVMAPSAYPRNSVQQSWGSAPQGVYPEQPPAYQYQQTPVWPGQQPGATYQQPTAPQYQYQYTPRPWGGMTGPNSNQNSNVSTETWPQGGYAAPWSMPQTGGNLGGAPAGQPWQPPGAVYYDSNW